MVYLYNGNFVQKDVVVLIPCKGDIGCRYGKFPLSIQFRGLPRTMDGLGFLSHPLEFLSRKIDTNDRAGFKL